MIDPALRCQPSGATPPMAGRGQFPYSRETIANFAYSTCRRGENGIVDQTLPNQFPWCANREFLLSNREVTRPNREFTGEQADSPWD